jgi:hypothetical protein
MLLHDVQTLSVGSTQQSLCDSKCLFQKGADKTGSFFSSLFCLIGTKEGGDRNLNFVTVQSFDILGGVSCNR